MLIFVGTFLLTSALWGFLLWLVTRPVVRHLQTNAEGRQAFFEHILTPMLGRPASAPKEDAATD